MKFIHTADWQLGRPFATVEDTVKCSLLKQERVNAIDRIGDVLRTNGASFVIVAGDLFDSPSVTKSTVSAACAKIGALGVPVFAIPGNHDHAGPGSVWEQSFFLREREQLAPNFHVLLKPEPVQIDEAVIFPCPLLHRRSAIDATSWLRGDDPWGDKFGQKPRIVVAHGSVHGFDSQPEDEDGAAAAGTNIVDVSRLSAEVYDYIALGDWHGTKQVGPKCWYPGTPELDRFPKGGDYAPGNVLIATVSRGSVPTVEPVRVARFGWHPLSFSFTDDADLDYLDQQVGELIGHRANEDLLRLELSGSLGIEATSRLAELLDSWRARLLRIKLTNRTVVAPTESELNALVQRTEDPLVSRVAQALMARASLAGDVSTTARIALRELHAACASKGT